MDAKGRNGWIRVAKTEIRQIQPTYVCVKFWSKRDANSAPCQIEGTPEEMANLCHQILSELDCFQAAVLRGSYGITPRTGA